MNQGTSFENKVISNPLAGGAALYTSVTQEVQNKINAGKFIEMSTLLDSKKDGEGTHYTLTSKMGEDGLLPVWTPFTQKGKPLSLIQWAKCFLKFASVYVRANPEKVQHLFSYMFNILDLATSKGDWAFYDTQFRKQQEMSGYSYFAHRVDLYTKAMTKGQVMDRNFRPSNSARQSNFRPQGKIPKGYCYAYHSSELRCSNGPQCQYSHRCFTCNSAKGHPEYMCFSKTGARNVEGKQSGEARQSNGVSTKKASSSYSSKGPN